MKLNHFICPSCGHDWYEDASYSTCDKCQAFFYLSQGREWSDFTTIRTANGFQATRPLDAMGIDIDSLKWKISLQP